MRITVELIQRSPQYMNALRERELSLRGKKIPLLENLGATLVRFIQDQFDVIDLTNNEIFKIEETAPLRRLNTLLLANNEISTISPAFGRNLPNLENLILTNNKVRSIQVKDLRAVDNLQACTILKRLSLFGNVVTNLPNYRYYVIHKLPHLMVLDFQKVKLKERQAADVMFGHEDGVIKKKRKIEELL